MMIQLSQRQKGIIMIAIGFVLLFHTLGILVQLLNVILVCIALVLIGYGCYRAEVVNFFIQQAKKINK